MRIGHGYDVHRLVDGRPLILGGVAVPFDKGLLGHSDADVLVHALMDAMLGAAALGDIGRHFPDSNPEYEGISSLSLLERVVEMLAAKGYALSNADITVIAQAPKLSTFIPQMENVISSVIGCEKSQINIKATTEEGLGFTGSGEGIACHAVCILT